MARAITHSHWSMWVRSQGITSIEWMTAWRTCVAIAV